MAEQPSTSSAAADGSSFARFQRWLGGELRTGDEVRDAVYLSVGEVGAKRSRFWVLLILAAMIATAGVVGDSTATVIGAMIVAPLATPIQGVAAGIASGEANPLFDSLRTLALATIVVIVIGAIGGALLPHLQTLAENSQVTQRVTPTLVDLAAAVATGLAGMLAVSRRDIADILPGVAIAISLVPPLAVVGVTAEQGDWDGALGSFLLFATNVLAIVVVGVALFAVLGVLRDGARESGERRIRRWRAAVVLVGTGVVILLALAASTLRTVRETKYEAAASGVAQGWAHDEGQELLSTTYEHGQVRLNLEASQSAPDTSALPNLMRGEVPSGTVIVVNRIPGQQQPVGHVP